MRNDAPMPSGSSNKQSAARAARLEREAAERAQQERKKRLAILGGAVGVVVVIVAIVLAAGVFKKDPAEKLTEVNGVRGGSDTASLFAGIPQEGIRLGKADAPATIVLFADLKCPFCKQQALETEPTVVKDLIRTGKANMELRLISVIDANVGTTDGQAARTAAFNLASSGKFWNFTHGVYANQGDETEAWATEGKLKEIAGGLAGVPKTVSTRETPASRELQKQADTLQQQLKVTGTPSAFVKPRGVGEYAPVENVMDPSNYASAVEAATKKAKPAAAR